MSKAPTIRRNTESEAALKAHLDRTFPRSVYDFMGKEHFWRIADKHGSTRKAAGNFFMQICFPVNEAGRPIDPVEELKLILSTRYEEGLPYPPIIISTAATGVNGSAHREDFKKGQGATDRIVRADSVLDFATNPEARSQVRLSQSAMQFLMIASAELVELPSQIG